MRIAKTFFEIIKYNKNHDRYGRFSTDASAVSSVGGKTNVNQESSGGGKAADNSKLSVKEQRKQLYDKWLKEEYDPKGGKNFHDYEKEHATYLDQGKKISSTGKVGRNYVSGDGKQYTIKTPDKKDYSGKKEEPKYNISTKNKTGKIPGYAPDNPNAPWNKKEKITYKTPNKTSSDLDAWKKKNDNNRRIVWNTPRQELFR